MRLRWTVTLLAAAMIMVVLAFCQSRDNSFAVLSMDYGERINWLGFSPDGRFLACCSEQRVAVWEWEKKRIVANIRPRGEVLQAVWINDKLLAAVALSSCFLVEDIGGSNKVSEISQIPARADMWYYSCVAFSAKKNNLAVGRSDGLIEVWDLDKHQRQHVLEEHKTFVRDLLYLPDGAYLISVGAESVSPPVPLDKLPESRDGEIILWDTGKYQVCDRIAKKYEKYYRVAYLDDSKTLFVSAYKRIDQEGEIKVNGVLIGRETKIREWPCVAMLEVKPPKLTLKDGHIILPHEPFKWVSTARGYGIALAPDGRHLLRSIGQEESGAEDGLLGEILGKYVSTGIVVLDTTDWTEIKRLRMPGYLVDQIAIHPNGKYVAVGLESSVWRSRIKLFKLTDWIEK